MTSRLCFSCSWLSSTRSRRSPTDDLSHAANISLTIAMTHRWFQTGLKYSKHTRLYSHTHAQLKDTEPSSAAAPPPPKSSVPGSKEFITSVILEENTRRYSPIEKQCRVSEKCSLMIYRSQLQKQAAAEL